MDSTNGALQPGDLCITGENSFPRFRVIAIHEDRTWIRDVETGKDAVVQLSHCHRLEDAPARPDALPLTGAPRRQHAGAPMPADERWPDGTPRL
jgi:hypothetical protein